MNKTIIFFLLSLFLLAVVTGCNSGEDMSDILTTQDAQPIEPEATEEKNDIDPGKNDGFFDNSVDMPSDDYLETILPEGEGWGIVEKHMINFSPDRYFLVVGASRIEKTETYETTEVQAFIFKGFKKQGYVEWLDIWRSQIWEPGINEIHIIKEPDISLIMIDFNSGGSSGYNYLLVLTLDFKGNVVLQSSLDGLYGKIERKENSIIVTGGVGKHEFSIENGEFSEKSTPRSEMHRESDTKAYFLLEGDQVAPVYQPAFTVRIGDTVAFVPQDEKTKKAFDSFEIDIFSDVWGAPLSTSNVNRLRIENSYTFTQTGVFNFGLYVYSSLPYELAEPTFTITVVP